MDDAIKKFIYTSVGLVAQTTTKIQEMINELIRDRKISEEEGKRIVEDFTSKTKSQSKELEDQIRSFSSKISMEVNATPEQEIRQLKEKIKLLEDRLYQSGDSQTRGAFTNEISPNTPEGHADEHTPLQEKKELFQQKLSEKEENSPANTIDKVAHNKHIDLDDNVLTPGKKIEAEQQRMQNQPDRTSTGRSEQDSQKANLGGPVLTPGKKVEQDSRDVK